MSESEVDDDAAGMADSELTQLKRQLRIMEKDYHAYKEHTKNLIRKQTYVRRWPFISCDNVFERKLIRVLPIY